MVRHFNADMVEMLLRNKASMENPKKRYRELVSTTVAGMRLVLKYYPDFLNDGDDFAALEIFLPQLKVEKNVEMIEALKKMGHEIPFPFVKHHVGQLTKGVTRTLEDNLERGMTERNKKRACFAVAAYALDPTLQKKLSEKKVKVSLLFIIRQNFLFSHCSFHCFSFRCFGFVLTKGESLKYVQFYITKFGTLVKSHTLPFFAQDVKRKMFVFLLCLRHIGLPKDIRMLLLSACFSFCSQ